MEQITSVANKRIKEILKLKEAKYRNQEQLFMVEGIHLVLEAYHDGIIKTLIGTPKGLASLNAQVEDIDEVIEVADNVADKLSDVKNSQSVFAVCIMKKPVVNYSENILLLDHIQDPGNIGTLIRSAASFDFQTIIASPNSVSYYNDKVLRSTQGNFFHVNLVNDYLISAINDLKTEGYLIIGTALHGDYKPLQKAPFERNQKYALIIGNEAKGISPELFDLIDINVMIEMEEHVESLNAGVAGSIIMYQINNI
ncbi:TrmH family RNA methyltransferase [[Acholeplasma] multilocale]|uniref:TrmH family RNA methyltransferase n=1 Tax=[Acholeplasma] multilocale TaxID=264638 RepID=UPI0003FAF03B|nr:RNA methyltransferase [[Acholeplasma] multilocale]